MPLASVSGMDFKQMKRQPSPLALGDTRHGMGWGQMVPGPWGQVQGGWEETMF